MSRVFWDTNLFIYLFENYGPWSKITAGLRERMLERGDQLLTSTLTLGEILVKPMELGDVALSGKYEDALKRSALLVPFDVKAAKTYGSLRSDRSLRAPDAIQLACAASAGVDLFVTNDVRLQGKHVAGIQFIVPLDRAPI
ncbi:MAG TPA: PIN domain-containing protein [Candidatus Angelobacter sp.]|jgi:predicted nucleic acid-binding protein|nr:PIN domain-containing protein [Candidatus Angelobacter sp.]